MRHVHVPARSVLYGAVLCCAARCGVVLYGDAVLCCAVRCCAVRCGAVLCGAVLCCAVPVRAVRCGAVLCCAVRCSLPLCLICLSVVVSVCSAGAVRCCAVLCVPFRRFDPDVFSRVYVLESLCFAEQIMFSVLIFAAWIKLYDYITVLAKINRLVVMIEMVTNVTSRHITSHNVT